MQTKTPKNHPEPTTVSPGRVRKTLQFSGCVLLAPGASLPTMRYISILAVCLLATGCGPADSRVQLSPEEQRLLAYLARDSRVIIESTQRNTDGHIVVVTSQGGVQQRYILAPDDPAQSALRLQRLDDACILKTAPNAQPGGGHGTLRP